MISQSSGAAVLVVGDDAELSGLIALNLRCRGYLVEQTDLRLAVSSRWAPSFGKPDLIILDVESPQFASALQVGRLMDRTWADEVPLILAADNPIILAKMLTRPPILSLPRPGDVGAIVAATRVAISSSTVGTLVG